MVSYGDVYKIGFSRHLSLRMYTLNRYAPYRVSPRYGGNDGINKETWFKRTYKAYRVEGKEFYAINDILSVANQLDLISIELDDLYLSNEKEYQTIYQEMDIFYQNLKII